jgi:AhpC/TSA antioxidant enzyme
MDPRTFIPPTQLQLAPFPAVGDPAPDAPPLGQVHGPAVVAFLRHVGCPFAESTVRAMTEVAELRREITWIVVSHASLEASDRWCAAVGAAHNIRLVIDERRELYAAWGLGRSTLAHFAGPRSLASVARAHRRGIGHRLPAGTRWQRAGTFAIDAHGAICWRHIPAHAGDLPDFVAAAAVAVI